ncbi:MAG: hypothetical protein EZS28_050195, partial [Streblomastix strix]
MMLAINLLQYGSDETQQKVIQAVPKERVAEWAESYYIISMSEVRIKPTSQQ